MMSESPIKEQIITELTDLDPHQLQEVLNFTRNLKAQTQGALGRNLMHLVGSIPPDDLALMEKVIEEDCERIDPQTWDITL